MKNKSPKIRVFVSSTFLDMQKERDVLNLEVFPVVKGVCDKLGVAFNAIDLRWGITQEDQLKGSVVDLCLDEIQHCKPYFIGLIGNRYGWIPDKQDPDLEEKFQFIKENEDKSVTELEMILGAISAENRDRCFFYYKDPKLFDPSTSDKHEDMIEALKQKINASDIAHNDYASYEQFKDLVLDDLLEAIKADYPEGSDMMEARQEAYLNLKESGFVDRMYTAFQAIDILTYAQEHHVPVAAISPHGLGKTSIFNHLINRMTDVDKIIINFEADVTMRYFPGHYLYTLIKNGLEQYGYELEDQPACPDSETLTNYESYIQAQLSKLKFNLHSLKYKRPLYILINDADLFFAADDSKTFNWSFLFDTSHLPDNLYVVITTNRELDSPMTCAKMHMSADDDPKKFFTDYLAQFAKKIDADILEAADSRLQYYDYKYIAEYLIYYCNFSSYKQVSRDLLSKSNFVEVLTYVYDTFVSGMSAQCASVFTEILLRLYYFQPGMSETALFDSYSKDTALESTAYQVYIDLTEIEKAQIMRCLRYFTSVESGTIFISEIYVKYFIEKENKHLLEVLSKTSVERARKAAKDYLDNMGLAENGMVYVHGKAYTPAEYMDFVSQTTVERNRYMEYALMDPLCVYLEKTIKAFAEELATREGAFEVDVPSDRDIRMMVYIQEAAKLYKMDTRSDSYFDILKNPDLMLFICARSHALYRRLIDDYYELQLHIQKTQFSRVDMNSMKFAMNYALDPIAKADKEKYSEFAVCNAIEQAIWVLEERDMIEKAYGEMSRLEEEEGEGALTLQDYAINACSNEAQERLYEIDYDSDEEDVDTLIEVVNRVIGYFNNTNTFTDRLLYGAYMLQIVAVLKEKDALPDDYNAAIPGLIKAIKLYLVFCFFPEVHTWFEEVFKAIQP